MTLTIKPLPPELTDLLSTLGNRKLVLVEGSDDADVFEEWYEERLAEAAFCPVGGETAIQARLNELQHHRPDVVAFGIRDRDFLSDAEVEAPLSDANAHIFVLRRYCIENYLLEPAAVYSVLRVCLRKQRKQIPIQNASDTEAWLLSLCHKLETIMAANWVLREKGHSDLEKGFDLDNSQAILSTLTARLGCSDSEAQSQIDAKKAIFGAAMTALDTAHTRINGKYLMFHIRGFAKEKQGGITLEHLFNLLLQWTKEHDTIHEDIRTIVEQRILR